MRQKVKSATETTSAKPDEGITHSAELARSNGVVARVATVIHVISQKDLSEYMELQASERSVTSLRNRKREELIQELQQGASVETGPIQVRLELRPP